jgi:hypothetical protein
MGPQRGEGRCYPSPRRRPWFKLTVICGHQRQSPRCPSATPSSAPPQVVPRAQQFTPKRWCPRVPRGAPRALGLEPARPNNLPIQVPKPFRLLGHTAFDWLHSLHPPPPWFPTVPWQRPSQCRTCQQWTTRIQAHPVANDSDAHAVQEDGPWPTKPQSPHTWASWG